MDESPPHGAARPHRRLPERARSHAGSGRIPAGGPCTGGDAGTRHAARDLAARITGCVLCTERFAATATGHAPKPVVWFRPGASILIAGQAPGARVQASGIPFDDPSGRRLRDWMGLDEAAFYDRSRVSILPMAFCFPGYTAKGADLPPPPICAKTWHGDALKEIGDVPLTLLVGGYAQRYHLGKDAAAGGVTATVARWRRHAPRLFPLPHPSWRNTAWLKKNPWFEAELVPELRVHVAGAMRRAPGAGTAEHRP